MRTVISHLRELAPRGRSPQQAPAAEASPGRRTRRRVRALVYGAAAVIAFLGPGVGAVHASTSQASQVSTAQVKSALTAPPTGGSLGPNVYVFTPSMSTASIVSTINGIANQQVSNQFGTQRYAFLFEPGTYGSTAAPLDVNVGYYTSVAGLGQNPSQVVINGTIDSYNQCDGTTCNATSNFWRSISNLTINVMGLTGCHAGDMFWATSQESPLRRVHINGAALAAGDNLLFTPGVYNITSTVKVTKADTKIIGFGFPTLVSSGGDVIMNTADVNGVNISGLIFDAGPASSSTLLQLGTQGSTVSHASDPDTVDDVTFRVGGETAGTAATALPTTATTP